MSISWFLLASLWQDNSSVWTWLVTANWMYDIHHNSFYLVMGSDSLKSVVHANKKSHEPPITVAPGADSHESPSTLSSTVPKELGRKATAKFSSYQPF